jgi:hypothetical protein
MLGQVRSFQIGGPPELADRNRAIRQQLQDPDPHGMPEGPEQV